VLTDPNLLSILISFRLKERYGEKDFVSFLKVEPHTVGFELEVAEAGPFDALEEGSPGPLFHVALSIF